MSNMKVRDTVKVDIIKLKLDVENPRFAELYNGSDNQDDLIEYLLNSESATAIVKELNDSQEYYADRPLWVIKQDDGSYLVKDGNRRLSAVLALRSPTKFGLSEPRQTIDELPVIVYDTEDEVNKRVRLEHIQSSFRGWDRIAKALEVYKMRSSGASVDSLKELDSEPNQLTKLASFYYAAVAVGKDDLKVLLRKGRGNTGGKTIVFERLFTHRTRCGYDFSGKAGGYEVIITDQPLFDSYIKAMVELLKANPDITHKTVDSEKETFLDRLKPYGFTPSKKPSSGKGSTPAKTTPEANPTVTGTGSTQATPTSTPPSPRKSIKTSPKYTRKGIPRAVDDLVKEGFNLDAVFFTNSKVAMSRVIFEAVLKYVIENTEYSQGKKLNGSNYFRDAYFNKHGNKLPVTNFDKLKDLFTALILDTGKKKAFADFDLERPHQIIHNYNVTAVPKDATAICDNLMPLVEFLLQEEQELLNGLDKNKL